MNKKSSFFIIALCISFFPFNSFAQTASSTPVKINARILPTIWYSTLSVNDGDSIRIYAGIQNNSGIDFSGTAVFYVDNEEISKKTFASKKDSLKDIDVNWVANPGTHSVQVKVSTDLSSSKELVSYESDKSRISITRKVTLEEVKETALNTASNIIDKADELASSLAQKIESYKQPIESIGNNVKSTESTSTANKGRVLGVSTSSISDYKSSSTTKSILNMFLDFLAFFVRNWKWTILGIVILIVVIKIKKSREE
ncbi:MAG: hypothetical protein WC229_03615 [Candidatus Paceibacterota bacterium]|jgi:hypothetical protein